MKLNDWDSKELYEYDYDEMKRPIDAASIILLILGIIITLQGLALLIANEKK